MRLEDKRDALATVDFNGNVLWIPQSILKSSCPIDITYFPFDTQKCKLKFGSWSYSGDELEMDFYDGKNSFELTEYIESNTWTLIQSNAVRSVTTYPCCPQKFVEITFYLVLQRKGGFYHYILALPCILLSMITLAIFWIPPESPSKMLLGMNVYVAFFVLLLLLSESTPKAASNVPLLGSYFVFNMVLITLSTFLAAVVVNFNMRGEKINPIPKNVKKVLFKIATIFGIKEEVEVIPAHKNLPEMYNLSENEIKQRILPSSVDADVRHICECVRELIKIQKIQDSSNSVVYDWRICAIILDRIFFIVYLTTNLVAVAFVFSSFI